MASDVLAPCPCGQVPASLSISDYGGYKYALASPSCCGEWLIEFRTNYKPLDSEACMTLAHAAWNAAPRGEP